MLLMTAATGAWADETLLLTIESRDYKTFKSGSKTFDDKVTVTFSNSVRNDGDNWGWYANSSESLLTVAGINGYTITSCKFYVEVDGIAKTGYTVEGESPSVYLSNLKVYTDNSQSVKIGANGVTKIEVYEAAPAPEASAGKQALKPSRPAVQPERPKPTIIPAPADDPFTARSEQMLGLVLDDKGQELYDNLSEKVKGQVQPNTFNGIRAQIEAQMGKYTGHEAWNIQEIQGMKAYTSLVNFEKSQLGMVVVFDEDGKMLGINFVPANAIKAQN